MRADRRASSGTLAVEREFIRLVEAQITNGTMTLERAAEFMLEHGLSGTVVAGVITRVQQTSPVGVQS